MSMRGMAAVLRCGAAAGSGCTVTVTEARRPGETDDAGAEARQ
jgi:hypothetical protein